MPARSTDASAHPPAAGEVGVGEVFAGYRIEALVARGAMGVLFRARHLRLGREVGLKTLAPDAAASEDLRRRFVEESRAAAALDHPGILPLYEAGDHDGTPFIATRLVEGDTLKDLLARRGRLSLEHALALVIQTGAALDAAHRRGLVHRDVKPASLLLVPDGPDGAEHVYLTDFGLTKRLEEERRHTRTGEFVGTIAYVAPEQIRGERLDGRADVYALGCVLYECVTGEAPFRRASDTDVLAAHCADPPPRPSSRCSDLPAQLDDVIATALAKAPDKRFATCAALSTALRGTRPQPVRAQAGEAPSPVRRHQIVIEDDTEVRLRRKVPAPATEPRPAGPVRRAVPSAGPTGPVRRVVPSPRPTAAEPMQPAGGPSRRRRPGRRVAAALIVAALAIAAGLTIGALLLTRDDGGVSNASTAMDIARRTGRLRDDVSGLARRLRAADQQGNEKTRRRLGRRLLERSREANQLSRRAEEDLASGEFETKLVAASNGIAEAAKTTGEAATSFPRGSGGHGGSTLIPIIDEALETLEEAESNVEDVIGKSAGRGDSITGPLKAASRVLTLPDDADLRFVGAQADDAVGSAVAGAGDVNGDGLEDIVAAAPGRGAAVVVFGSRSPEDFSLDDIGERGILISGLPATAAPSAEGADSLAVAPAGDVDGDGLDDVLVGAPSADDAGEDAGAAFVIFGRGDGGEVAADRLTSESGWRLDGKRPNERLGGSVAAADVDGDDRPELVLGAAGSLLGAVTAPIDALASSAYVVPTGGSRDAVPDLGDALIRIRGAGEEVAALGDVNGDGLDDVAISDTEAREGAPPSVEVVYGREGQLDVDVSRPGDWGLSITGSQGENEIGDGVAAAGDLDGDGLAELLVPDPAAGTTWVIRGQREGTILDLGKLGEDGFAIKGGGLAAGGVDVNGDGKSDVSVVDASGARVLFGDLDRLRRAGTGSPPAADGFQLRTDAPASALALVADTDGDQRGEAVVGASESSGGAGGVFVVSE